MARFPASEENSVFSYLIFILWLPVFPVGILGLTAQTPAALARLREVQLMANPFCVAAAGHLLVHTALCWQELDGRGGTKAEQLCSSMGTKCSP